MFQDAFVKLESPEVEQLLSDVNPSLEGASFEANTTTVMVYDLPFYPGYRFVDISNYQEHPSVHRYLIYKPGEITVLNWSNEPIYQLNQNVPIQLNDSNVFEYVRFFFTYVSGRHGRFIISENVDDIQWREEPPPAARKAIGQMIGPLKLLNKESDGTYNIEASMMFKDSLFKAQIHVKPNGLVSLSNEELVIEDMPVLDDVFDQ